MNQFASLSRRATEAPESGIVAVVNHGRLKPGLIPLWAGEGDEATPDFISRSAADALGAGETFYTWQRGIPELRQALADYHARLFGRTLPLDAFCVTGSGMQAIKIAIEAITDPGDEVIQITPAWPKFRRRAGHVRRHRGSRDPRLRQWKLEHRSRPDRRRHHAPNPRPVHQLALQPHRLDRDTRRSGGHSRSGAQAWPVDHRRRDLHPIFLCRRPRAFVSRHHGRQ